MNDYRLALSTRVQRVFSTILQSTHELVSLVVLHCNQSALAPKEGQGTA